ncbi:hypothetical protein [Mesorhizobium sp. IMUNJ 23232]|uniref:hypothetical protein n=1 Tax=Mesorhizobium sp. IMUNJ 23232 TaxID=3376064 RepID=UPI0037B89F9A
MRSDKDTEHKEESIRILARVAGEAEPGGAALDHETRDASDPIEKLGIRIGRLLAMAITIAVIAWVVVYFMRNF